jgi:anti-anti-sigma factor
MPVSSPCGMISGDEELWLLPDRTDGGGVIKSDSTIFEVAQRDGREDQAVLVKLSGEFDVRYEKILEYTLSDCLTSGRPAFVDLSEVTFMDSRCVRELAIYYQLGEGRVALCDPSWEIELSVAASDLEEWMDFVYTTSGDPPGYAAPGIFHEAAIRLEKGTCSCAHHTRR